MKRIAIGVDVGGTHICSAACDIEKKIYFPETFSENKLNNKAAADDIIEIWGQTIRQTIDKVGIENIEGLGFAMSGPFDYFKGIARFERNDGRYQQLNGVNIAVALRAALNLPADFPIRFINNATAFAIGEYLVGRSFGSRRSMAITLGSTLGSAFLSHHLPVVMGVAVPWSGCLWHLPFEDGIADDYFSARGLLNRYLVRSGIPLSGVKDIYLLAPFNYVAMDIFIDLGYKLGLFLSSWLLRSNVEVLVIGGNISKAYSFFGESLKKALVGDGVNVRIEISGNTESSTIIGSTLLFDEPYYEHLIHLLPLMS